MKKLSLLLCGIAFVSISTAQTYSSNFIDGQVMFKLNQHVNVASNELNRTDKHSFSLKEKLAKYPKIAEALTQYSVTKFERPSYYTGKKELMKLYTVSFSNFSKIDALVKTLSQLDGVEFAEKMPIYYTDFIPNDAFHSGNDKWYHTLVGSEAAWDISLGSSTVKVAVVDNAVYSGHSDLTAFSQRDVADNDNDATPPLQYTSDQGWSHGTHVAGLATADINNGIGIASLGGNVELIGVKTRQSGSANAGLTHTFEGVQWACQNGANVVNMSYGGPSSSQAMQNLIDAFPNVVFVAAAGNDGNSTQQFPAAYNNVICVGSVDSDDGRSSFSNFNGANPYVDIASPGGHSFGGLLSTVYTTGGNNYGKMGGTSMASPFAAGLVGLMLSINPTLTPAQIEACLISTGVNINQNVGPRINALAALQCVQATVNGDPIPAFAGIPTAIQEGQTVSFTDQSADGGNTITNWNWTFPGGSPASFVGQTPPAITYAVAGTYDVTLTVTNSQNTTPLTKSNYITVTLAPFGDWIVQNSGFSTASRGLSSISIIDASIVWASGNDGTGTANNIQEFTKTINGGTSWTPGVIDVGNSALGIGMLTATDANTAWVPAFPNGGGQTGGIWKTTNGGTTWARQNTAVFNNAASFANVIHFWDANVGFCQGDPINGDFELYTTTNGGTNWTAVPGGNIPNPLNANEFGYTSQIDVVGNSVWFSTSIGRLYHSTDKGLTWQAYQTPVSDFGGAIDANSTANFSFSSATDGLIIDNNQNVYKTTNSGATWAQLTTTGSVFTTGLCFVEGTNTAFSTGQTGSSFSQDGGTTWNIIDTDQHTTVEFSSLSIGWSGWFTNQTNSAIEGVWKWNNLASNLTADFQASPSNVCVGTTVQFNDLTTGATPTSWLWSFPGGTPNSSTIQNPTVSYAAAGFYTVSLTVDDGNGATTKIDSAHVSIVANPVTPVTLTGSISVCPNSTETYSVPSSGASYTWTLPSGWSGSSTNNSISTTVGITGGNVEVTADNICGSSAPQVLAVNVMSSAIASFTSTNAGNTENFTSSSTNATSWSWDFGDGGTSTQENPSHTYTSNGNFSVELCAGNTCDTNCTTQSITILTVGVSELSGSAISIYPNPTKNNIFIDGLYGDNTIKNKEIKIVDVLGKVVFRSIVNSPLYTIDVSSFNKGLYFISLDNNKRTYKLIKE